MFKFTIRALLGLVVVEGVTLAAAKKGLAADSLEEVLLVFVLMVVSAAGYFALLFIARLMVNARIDR